MKNSIFGPRWTERKGVRNVTFEGDFAFMFFSFSLGAQKSDFLASIASRFLLIFL